jgi:hypothetical protein
MVQNILSPFSDIFNLFLNKSKFVMNIYNIYNNLNNYSSDKTFTSTPPSQGQKQKNILLFYFKI